VKKPLGVGAVQPIKKEQPIRNRGKANHGKNRKKTQRKVQVVATKNKVIPTFCGGN